MKYPGSGKIASRERSNFPDAFLQSQVLYYF
jgi:hypothetical protein